MLTSSGFHLHIQPIFPQTILCMYNLFKKNKNLIIAMLPLWPRFLQGTCSEAPYAFYHWHHIDIFNYFTHTLVTIPPAVWTSAAHKHGVVVIGE